MMLDGAMHGHFPEWCQSHEGSGSGRPGPAGAGCIEDGGSDSHGLGFGSGDGHSVAAVSEGHGGRDRVETGNDVEMVTGGNAVAGSGVAVAVDLLGVHHGVNGGQADLGGSSGGFHPTDSDVRPPTTTTTVLEVYHRPGHLQWHSHNPFQEQFPQQKQALQAHVESQLHFQYPQPHYIEYQLHQEQLQQEQLQQEQPHVRQEQPPQAHYGAAAFYSLAAPYQPMSHDHLSDPLSFLPPNPSLSHLFHQSALHLQPFDDSSTGTVRNLYHGVSQLSTTESSPAVSDQPFGSLNPVAVPQPYAKSETASTTASSRSDAASVSPVITSPDTTRSAVKPTRRTKRRAGPTGRRRTQTHVHSSSSSRLMTPAATPTGRGDAPFGQSTVNTNASPFQPPKPDAPPQPGSSKRNREECDCTEEEHGQDEVTQAPDESRLKKRRGRPRGRPRLTETVDDVSAVERRRTQIRVAQRAYRDRKDQTITRLEGEVERLKKIKDGIFQGVIDILELIRSHNVSNLPQVGPEFGPRFERISRRIVRLNAGEDVSQSADHPASPDRRLGLSTSTGDGEVRTSSPASTAIEVFSTSPTKQPASKSAVTRNTKNKIQQQTLKTPPRVEPIAYSAHHHVPHPVSTSGIKNTNKVVGLPSHMPSPSSHTQLGSDTSRLEDDRLQPTAFQRRLEQCLAQRLRRTEGTKAAIYPGPLVQSAQVAHRDPSSQASLTMPNLAGDIELPQLPRQTTASLEDRQGPVLSLRSDLEKSIDPPRPLEPPVVSQAEPATFFNNHHALEGLSAINYSARSNIQRSNGDMHNIPAKATFASNGQSPRLSNPGSFPEVGQRRAYDHSQHQPFAGQNESVQDQDTNCAQFHFRNANENEEHIHIDDVNDYLRQRGVVVPQKGDTITVEIDPNDFNGSAHLFADGKSHMSDMREIYNYHGNFQRRMSNPAPLAEHHPNVARAASTVHDASITPMFTDGTATGANDTGSHQPSLCPAIPPQSWLKDEPGKANLTIDIGQLFTEIGVRTMLQGQSWVIRPRDIDQSLKIASNLALPQSQ